MSDLNKPALLTSTADWDLKWAEIFDQYQHDLRHAYYINALKNSNENHLLEIAAGSFRDMSALCRWNIKCEGMDFSFESVARAKKQFPDLSQYIHQMDAFNFNFNDDTFGMTYHNGFWILFNDNDIDLLAKEQARISKYRIIATVHNAHNKNFVDYFNKKAETDPLFKIRFFYEEEMRGIMLKVCSKVTIVPVGKGKKYHEDEMINNSITDPAAMRSFFEKTGTKYINESERLLCIGEL